MKSSFQARVAVFFLVMLACSRLAQADVYNGEACGQSAACCPPTTCCNYDAKFGVSYLYWGAHAEELGFAIEDVLLMGLPPEPTTGSQKTHEPKWGSGFRLDGDIYNRCIPVGCRFQYTYFRTTSHASADSDIVGRAAVGVTGVSAVPNGDGGSSMNNGGNPFLTADSAKSKWNIRANEFAVDFEYLGWSCGSCVFVQPYAGVLGACINQKQNIHYRRAVINEGRSNERRFDIGVSRRSEFWGVGPRFGVEVEADLWCRLKLVTDINAAFLVGRCSSHSKTTTIPAIDQLFMGFKEGIRCARPMFGGLIGIEWYEPLACGCTISLGASYEFQYWWQQWHNTSNLLDNMLSTEGRWGDLSMHGLVFTARVSF